MNAKDHNQLLKDSPELEQYIIKRLEAEMRKREPVCPQCNLEFTWYDLCDTCYTHNLLYGNKVCNEY